ncbi:MAG: bifunctional molybdenum cofactor biosynthesis protein MoaC/MoaB [Nitrosopumilus sp.]|uniref:bifunctional molybdenum cofactor biosynthesis protein MoaC/MoaB n=1 Tax=Nitrosopumilus sp. TaxID=2024843 RepID=UPI00292E6073|nr:bifunctional molybdenum cofactor biosynthesis protein MoaC/MoaB [Nitrosopumilus sp.]
MDGMFDVGHKQGTYRIAKAQAILQVKPETITLIKEGKTPKGDVFEAAKVAGTLAVKKTPDLLPYCHPLPIDNVTIHVSLNHDSLEITAETETVWKTGIEMESLTAVSIAALSIYDMLKPVDDSLVIESVKLLNKKGGKSDFKQEFDKKLQAAILITSDSISSGEKSDQSGKIIVQRLEKLEIDVVESKIIPDDVNQIESLLKQFCDEQKIDLVLTCGGTGVGPRDMTPEATIKVLEKQVTGVAEMLRNYGQQRVPFSMLSRGLTGIRGNSLIVNLPGSTNAVNDAMDSLFPGILHIFKMMENEKH